MFRKKPNVLRSAAVLPSYLKILLKAVKWVFLTMETFSGMLEGGEPIIYEGQLGGCDGCVWGKVFSGCGNCTSGDREVFGAG